MEAQRAELELPQATVNALQGQGQGPCLASWSNPPPVYHAVYELVLQELNAHHMLWTLQEDLTATPRDLEPNPLREELPKLLLPLQINSPVRSHPM